MAETRMPARWRIWLALALVALLVMSGAIATFYTDALWFEELGQAGVFWTSLGWMWGVGLAAGLLAFVIVYVNLRLARSMAPTAVLRSTDERGFQLEMTVQQVREVLERAFGWVLLAASAVVALAAGVSAAGGWEAFALWANGVSFGVADPQFGQDVGFYFFTLPALRTIADYLTGVLATTLAITAVIHLLTGAIRPWAKLRGFDPHVKAHLSVLAGLIIWVRAFVYWIDIYELNFSPRGQVVGASYTDVHAQLPALQILIVVAVLSGIALLVNIRFRGWRLPAIALGVWLGALILVGSVYPGLVQQFRVAPNEVAAEAPYLERNIEMTRRAFGLEDVEVRPFAAAESLGATDLAANAQTISNVRLWDPAIVAQTYQQLQGIRPYYEFTDVDIDRYELDGVERQVLVSVREMNVGQLASQAQTWVNQHLVYTHGYGAVVSPVNEFTGQGLPSFIVQDIPPQSASDIEIERPGVYFGEQSSNYVLVNTGLPEFDYPVGDQNATTTYDGEAGIGVGGGLRRAAFALRFSAPQILFSEYIQPDSKVLFRRQITERIATVAPWLHLDGDPYPIVVDGRIVWVVDAYTASDRYPYSERIAGGLNYIRNSVKVTVDAYDGTTTFYAFQPDDPLLQTWADVFPGLLTDFDQMPEEIRAHLRYPEDLFRIQAEVYKTYHMQDPQVFYNKEDQWALPGETGEGGDIMDPFYVLMRLPDEADESFMLMVPFTPRNKDNMIGWMAAKSDPDDYGRRVVYTFPKQKLVLGPEQVSARVNQDPVISQQLTLWSQRGSGVLFGNLLVIPIEESVVYIQPLYLQAERTAMPQLTRVIVAYADSVAMETDLTSALTAVFGEGTPDSGGRPSGEPTEGDAALAQQLYDQALDAQRAGDWAAYGELIEQLGVVLGRLAGTPSVEPTTAP
ncbi:MAG: UPF0182 family protein [Anaerosomatales bacterium]|nr:UPF0182 family protein [Anaerosomatales bacterium]